MILLTKNSVFVHPKTGEVHTVHPLPDKQHYDTMIPMEYYALGSHVYRYLGDVPSRRNIPTGSIYRCRGYYGLQDYDTEEEKLLYGASHVIEQTDYEQLMTWHKDMEQTAKEYMEEYDTNMMATNRNKLANTGDVFVPELKETDDPMERVIKLMVLHMKLKLNERRNSFDKEYGLDNLRSALNGATKNMSILKFLMWCDLLELDWEFSVINTDDHVPHPLDEPVIIGNKTPLEEELPTKIPKGIFQVPLQKGEDPLKRLIKVAIWRKQINLKDYKGKGSTSHLINNMRSGLKGKQKMSISGMLNWCEVLDLILIVKVTNPANGIWYKAVGYDIYSNVPEDENSIYAG